MYHLKYFAKGEHTVDILTFRDFYENCSIEENLNLVWTLPLKPIEEMYLTKLNAFPILFELNFQQ